MPHDVTMPQLGMAQDAGRIVAWLKAPGEAVAKGDALFEVETDKATMEVEAQTGGYLTGISANEGDDVPVGAVIARISETAEDEAGTPAAASVPEPEPEPEPEAGAALPEGKAVTMPQLGMAQDSGLLVGWLKTPGEAVAADDLLFEVETDKSTMEVPAGLDGYLAATLAEAGEEVPVGQAVAVISAEKPEAPLSRSAKNAGARPAQGAVPEPAAASAPKTKDPAPEKARAPQAAPPGGRILASPKARRLALEQGLDLGRLAEAGHPQPFHVADLEALRALPDPAAAPATSASASSRRLTATVASDGLPGFVAWVAEAHGLKDADAILAGFAGASLNPGGAATVAIERPGARRAFTVPPGRALSAVAETGDAPALVLRDLRGTALSGVEMGAEEAPVLTLTHAGGGLTITLECAASGLDAAGAIRLLTDFAGRMEQPLRHLL